MDRRELLVLRHGKSDWDAGAADDFARPLAKRGRKASRRIGRWMAAMEVIPDLVLSSPAQRARSTTELICECTDIDPARVSWVQGLYDADSAGELLPLLAAAPAGARRVLLVGHNPALEALVRYLADDSVREHEARKFLPTAALARLALPRDWSHLEAGCARVLAVVRPRQLGET